MKTSMKIRAKLLIRTLGIDVSRYRVSPYENLIKAPRFQKHNVMLMGRSFTIADGPSFAASYRELFIDEIYQFESSKERPFIVDCGSNYGTSIAYFKKLYPKAEIIAVEADPDIYRILSNNLKSLGLKNVEAINRAVAVQPGGVTFHQQGADGGSMHALPDSKESVQVESISLDELLNRPVDFLKIDIEGAEVDVICGSDNLQNAEQVFIEYHSYYGEEQGLDRMLKKLRLCGFRYYIHKLMAPPKPFMHARSQNNMDMQLNIFCIK